MLTHRGASLALTILCVGLLASCTPVKGGLFDKEKREIYDEKRDLTRDDYRNMAKPKQKNRSGYDSGELETAQVEVGTADVPPIPDVAQILAAPRPPKIGETQLVSLSVTDDVPLKDVLIELARLADVDVELDAGIQGGISFRAKERPFNEVIERIANLAGLRYSMKNGVLRVERDVPYVKNYRIDFLNLVRSSQNSVNISTDVLSAGGEDGDSGGSGGSTGSSSGGSSSGDGGGLTTGSSASITADVTSDFWEALESSLGEILNYVPGSMSNSAALSGASSGGTDLASVLDPSAAAAGGSAPTAAGGAAGGSNRTAAGSFFVINRQAGVVSVSGTQRQHELVADYLGEIKRNASAQVLIEAKILEVTLSERFQSGVDWSAVVGNTDLSLVYTPSIPSETNLASFTLLGSGPRGDNNLGVNLDALVNLVSEFGTTRTLSSPRLHAMNNQQAVLTFAQNRVFFELDVERENDQVVNDTLIPGAVTVDTTRRSVPIGIILNILPSVDLDDQEITLNVRPTLSRQVDTVTDPGSAIATGILQASNPDSDPIINDVPIVEVRELDSIMKIRSGQVMVIGGLMEESGTNSENGLPKVSEIPFFGNAFKANVDTSAKRELIIMIKASIVDSSGGISKPDRNVIEKFADDPRPVAF